MVGVARPDGRYEAVNVPDPDRVSSDVSSACARDTFNRRSRLTVRSEVVDTKVVVGVAVPEACPGEKPVYLPKVGLPKGAYRRIGRADVKCSDDDIRLFHPLALKRPYEDPIATDATMEDLEVDVVVSFRTFLLDPNPNTERRDLAPLELVQALLLFGKPLALMRLPWVWRVEYIRQHGTEWIDDTERCLDAMAFRKIAVREALANALTHRGYHLHSPFQVIRYRDRIEVRNAGPFLVVDDDLGCARYRGRATRAGQRPSATWLSPKTKGLGCA